MHMHEGVPPNPGSYKYFIRSDIMVAREESGSGDLKAEWCERLDVPEGKYMHVF